MNFISVKCATGETLLKGVDGTLLSISKSRIQLWDGFQKTQPDPTLCLWINICNTYKYHFSIFLGDEHP